MSGLTARELDILRLVAAGHTDREIGKELYLAENTIKSYLKLILRKSEARNRTHAVYLATSGGLI